MVVVADAGNELPELAKVMVGSVGLPADTVNRASQHKDAAVVAGPGDTVVDGEGEVTRLPVPPEMAELYDMTGSVQIALVPTHVTVTLYTIPIRSGGRMIVLDVVVISRPYDTVVDKAEYNGVPVAAPDPVALYNPDVRVGAVGPMRQTL